MIKVTIKMVAVFAICGTLSTRAFAHETGEAHEHLVSVDASYDGKFIDRCVLIAGEPALRCDPDFSPMRAANLFCVYNGYEGGAYKAGINTTHGQVMVMRVDGDNVDVIPHPVPSGEKHIIAGVQCKSSG